MIINLKRVYSIVTKKHIKWCILGVTEEMLLDGVIFWPNAGNKSGSVYFIYLVRK